MPLRLSHRVQVLVCAALTVVGVALLALPSSVEGPVLLPISEGHGLSALDSVGAGLLAIGATWLEVLVEVRLPRLGLPPRAGFGLGLLAGLGVGLVVASVYSGLHWWWVVGAVAVGVAAVLLAVLTAIR
jgi:hypothetical protein